MLEEEKVGGLAKDSIPFGKYLCQKKVDNFLFYMLLIMLLRKYLQLGLTNTFWKNS